MVNIRYENFHSQLRKWWWKEGGRACIGEPARKRDAEGGKSSCVFVLCMKAPRREASQMARVPRNSVFENSSVTRSEQPRLRISVFIVDVLSRALTSNALNTLRKQSYTENLFYNPEIEKPWVSRLRFSKNDGRDPFESCKARLN